MSSTGLRADGAVLLLSLYELGHSPHGLALPLAFLERAGYQPAAQDLALDPLDEVAAATAGFIGVSVPMHTALRLGALLVPRLRALNPTCYICAFGLYAPLNSGYLRSLGVDSVLGGELEAELVVLVDGLALGLQPHPPSTVLTRLDAPRPNRTALPGLDRYARLARGEREHLAGYTEASRGCLHRCRHCPVPAVYDGRFFVFSRSMVLADIAAQIAAGAEHITFGDPDFFNGPGHAMVIVRELKERWPTLTFDVTIKVSHLLKHAVHLAELADLGCAFVVTAVESLSDRVLAHLHKGHTRVDFERVLAMARRAGLVLRPTFVPFTPWSTLDDMVELVDFIAANEFVDCVDPVQLSVRLLVPPGSLLLADPDTREYFGDLDPSGLSYRWVHGDARMDDLQRTIAEIVERDGQAAVSSRATFERIRAEVYRSAHRLEPIPLNFEQRTPLTPRLTEHWFC